MSEQTESLNTSQGEVSDKLSKLFDNYEKGQTPGGGTKKVSREDKLKKYFVPRNKSETFRVLPPLPKRDYVETAYFHVVKVNTPKGKKFKKIYCPAHNNPKVPKLDENNNPIRDREGKPVMVAEYCPLCEMHKHLLSKQNPSLKGIKKEDMTPEQLKIKDNNDKIYKDAVQWEAKKFYILRGIDKGAEKDGVKFWRFKHNYKSQGVFDKLVPALNSFFKAYGKDFTDVNAGSNITVTVVDAQMPGNSNYTYKDVTSVMPNPPSKLHDDPIVVKQWLSDTTTWRDVFKAPQVPQLTPAEYMKRVVRGTDPYWDDTDASNKKWVFPDPADAALQELANTRNLNLDSDNSENMDMASDLEYSESMIMGGGYSTDGVTIGNVTAQDVGTWKDDSVDMSTVADDVEDTSSAEDSDDYEDLPF